MLTIVVAISVLSGLTQLAGYLAYSKHVFWGSTKPNAASWSIWAFGAVLESLSYIFLTGDILKNILPMVCAICAVLFFFVCIVRGHFEKITKFEWSIVVTDIIITVIWYFTGSAFYANVLLVITAVVSFIPIFMHVYKNPTYENAFPWFIWTTAYGLQTAVVLMRYEKAEDLIYPIVFFILHIVVAILSLDFRKRKYLATMKDMSSTGIPEHL